MLKNKITKVIESKQKNKIAHQEEKNSSTWMRIILCGLFLLCVMIFQVIKMPDGMWKTAFIIVEGILGLYFWVKLIKNPILNIRKMESEVETIAELYQSVAEKEKQLSLQNKQLKNDNKVLLESEKRWKELAFFDGLTKLPNRKMIIQELKFLCEQVEDEKNHFAVVFIDLDNFKKINDSSGHHAGDKLLKVIGEKLKLLIHPEDMIGRLGGDEFALLIRRSMDKKEIIIYIENIKSVLLEIFKVEAREYNISASFGVAFSSTETNPQKLLSQADKALYEAKACGRNQVKCYRERLVEAKLY